MPITLQPPSALQPPSENWQRAFNEYRTKPHFPGNIIDMDENSAEYQEELRMAYDVYGSSETWDDLIHSNLEWFNGIIKATPTYFGSNLDDDHSSSALNNLIRLHREYRVYTYDGQAPRDEVSPRVYDGLLVQEQQRSYLEGAFPISDIDFWHSVIRKTDLMYYFIVLGTGSFMISDADDFFDKARLRMNLNPDPNPNPEIIQKTGHYFMTNIPANDSWRYTVTQSRERNRQDVRELRRPRAIPRPEWKDWKSYSRIGLPELIFISGLADGFGFTRGFTENLALWSCENVCYFSFFDRRYNGRSVESQLFDAIESMQRPNN